MLNPQSPIPLYHQLADLLIRQIKDGRYKTGDIIPSETGLAKTYGIGRPTVRQAMDMLVRKGLVERKRGSGTYVMEQKPSVDLFSLAGTSQAFETKGIKTKVETIAPICITPVSNDTANPFNNTEAYFVSRITRVDRLPVLVEDIYLHTQVFPGLDTIDLADQSLAQVVADQYYLKPSTGRQQFKIEYLTLEKARFLEQALTDPILAVERFLDFPNAENAVFSRLYCRTDRFAFSQTIGQGTNLS